MSDGQKRLCAWVGVTLVLGFCQWVQDPWWDLIIPAQWPFTLMR